MHIDSISRVLVGMIAVVLASQGIAEAQFATGAPPGSPGHEIIHLKGDLYRFRQVRHYGMFLHTSEGIILVDPANTEAATWLKAEFARRFKVPVKYVIYSHAHNDHASGGEVFADTATFVAHENMAKNLVAPGDGAPLLPREALWDTNGNGGIEQSEAPAGMAKDFAKLDVDRSGRLSRREIWAIRFGNGAQDNPPDIVYRDFMSLSLGGKTVELHYTGLNHSDDMSVVRFPEERFIYTVDHLTPKRLPRGDLDGGFLPEWLDSLKRIEQLDFDYVSPGHESVGPKADVSEQVRYMSDLVKAVSDGIAAGKSKAELVKSVRLEQYKHLLEYDMSRAANVEGAYEMLTARRRR
jgi:glyoxylase-like metal-dependent hydrolase (beta-lactamase superfamily II)